MQEVVAPARELLREVVMSLLDIKFDTVSQGMIWAIVSGTTMRKVVIGRDWTVDSTHTYSVYEFATFQQAANFLDYRHKEDGHSALRKWRNLDALTAQSVLYELGVET